jgi:hypothetical protein
MQLGGPVSPEAIELNGEAIMMPAAAFRWGRRGTRADACA